MGLVKHFANQTLPLACGHMTTIIDRIERELGIPGVAALLAERVEPADLQSLLLDVYRRVAARRQAGALLADYESNRFVRPSRISPSLSLDWERVALSSLPAAFEALELSPVSTLGTTSAMTGLSQDRALSTIRNTEVVSDSTNVLALEAALRRRKLKHADARSMIPVHLAASHRLLRTQRYTDPRLSSHFRVFALCSAGRDRGAFQFELEAFALQVGFYVSALRLFLGKSRPLRVALTLLADAAALSDAADSSLRRLADQFDNLEAVFAPERTVAREYYRTLCFWILAPNGGGGDEPIQLVDGGCVDWTQHLLSDAKERLLVSGVGSDRVCTLAQSGPNT